MAGSNAGVIVRSIADAVLSLSPILGYGNVDKYPTWVRLARHGPKEPDVPRTYFSSSIRH